MKNTTKMTPKVAFLGLLSINKDTAWTCPNGQVNRGKDLTCWDKPCGCGAKQPDTTWTHKGCGGRIVGVDPDGKGNVWYCSKCGSDEV